MVNKKRKFIVYLSYLVSIFFLYLTLKGIDYNEVIRSIRTFDTSSIFFIVVIYLSAFLLRGVRMCLILDNKINTTVAISSNLIAYALNNFIPLKGGDIYKLYFISKQAGIRKAVSTASVLIERLFDLLSILFIFIVMIYYLKLDTMTWKIINLLYIVMALLMLLSIILYFMNKYKHINLEKYIRFVNSDTVHVFIECWQRMLSHKNFTKVLLLSLFIWGIEGLVFFVILGYESMPLALIWMSTLALSFVIPNAPGNIGLFEWVSVFVLSKFGYGVEQALSLGLIVHFIQFFSVTLVGMILYFYFKRKLIL